MNVRILNSFLFLFILLSVSLCSATEPLEDIRDIKPPVAYPLNFWFLLTIGVLLCLAVLSWFVFRKGSQRKSAKQLKPAVPRRPAWEIALEELESLMARNLPASGQIKEYFSRLSDIVRYYIERQFDLRAPEMTTPEFLDAMNKTRVLCAEHKQILRDFLACCDMVKFAKYGPSEKEIEAAATMTKNFIMETQPSTAVHVKA